MLLIIDNYDSFTYNLYQAFATLYQDIRIIRNDKLSLETIRELAPAGIILSPGPGRPEEAGICVDLIRAIVDGALPLTPLLGVCLGHQALTVALGGRVIQAEEIQHGKADFVLHHHTGLYKNMPMPFQAGRYHSLVAERETLPASLVIDAENKARIIMGVRHQTLPLHGVQFHPESILTPEGGLLLKAFVEVCK